MARLRQREASTLRLTGSFPAFCFCSLYKKILISGNHNLCCCPAHHRNLQTCSGRFCEEVSRVSASQWIFDAGNPRSVGLSHSPTLHTAKPWVCDRGRKAKAKNHPCPTTNDKQGVQPVSCRGEANFPSHLPSAPIPKHVMGLSSVGFCCTDSK